MESISQNSTSPSSAAKKIETGTVPVCLKPVQNDLLQAKHLVNVFPLRAGDMPAAIYHWYFRAHSVKSLERNLLGIVGHNQPDPLQFECQRVLATRLPIFPFAHFVLSNV